VSEAPFRPISFDDPFSTEQFYEAKMNCIKQAMFRLEQFTSAVEDTVSRAVEEAQRNICTWTLDHDNTEHTGCGQIGPNKPGMPTMSFCGFCGRRMRVAGEDVNP
jgi:hypothetical protein